MLKEVSSKTYFEHFPVAPHPFISEPFIEFNSRKAEEIVRLIDDGGKPAIGLVAGIRNGELLSPFSAPFGGFHFQKENIYIYEIDNFISSLKAFIESKKLKGIRLTIPPDIYHLSFNAKIINSLIRYGFSTILPDITNWVDLKQFNGEFNQKNSREYYRQAVRNNLSFALTDEINEKKEIFDLIQQNRARFNRPIYMSFDEIIRMNDLWPVDFFRVNSENGEMVASAIFYRNDPEICYAVFWGDNETGRPLRAMDFLILNLWLHYKNLGLNYIDLGISTESGDPNIGLLRFKETHEATSSLRYSVAWKA